MNSRRRFLETMSFGTPDHPPLYWEGMRDEVISAWKRQGMRNERELRTKFSYDKREEIEPYLYPLPSIRQWPESNDEVEILNRHLDPTLHRRLPKNWRRKVQGWKERESTLILKVHDGFFLSMGVEHWGRFEETIELTIDKPQLVGDMMMIQSEFSQRLAERILADVEVDAFLFSEPISSSHGPLISPQMYEDLVLPSYEPLFDLAEECGVDSIILRTYANTRALLPAIFKTRINCLWACECNYPGMDYRLLRQEFGQDVRLIGGIDSNILLKSEERIRREVEAKVPILLEQGGYVPLLNGRIRRVVPYKNYITYRQLLEDMVIHAR